MKVTHVNTTFSEAYAYVRLHKALMQQGIESRILTQEHSGNLQSVYDIKMTLGDKIHARWDMMHSPYRNAGKLIVDEMPFSFGVSYRYITNYELIRDSDIINLHWICNTL